MYYGEWTWLKLEGEWGVSIVLGLNDSVPEKGDIVEVEVTNRYSETCTIRVKIVGGVKHDFALGKLID